MATCLKRTSKLFDISLIRGSAQVNLRDLICPICRGILIEPVTLPCTHNLCLRCLKGTFEHNSLTCPLCRVRVGSWLRTATKSETLVNSALWKLIRTRFPKEVEGKRNGEDEDIELDSDFAPKKIILSAAGEIRREYEVQLRAAEEEMRRQRESERLANEALIRKIQEEEEREKLSQLASDRLLAESLAKKQLMRKDSRSGKHRCDDDSREIVSDAEGTSGDDSSLEVRRRNLRADEADKTSSKTKIRDDKNSTVKIAPFAANCQKINCAPHEIVTRTLKQREAGKSTSTNLTSFSAEPSCSGAQIYGSRSKEELHVPIDILSSKKKTLGVEVCLTKSENDERIGSAESAASHDSINQEIHHFKPIKPIARTTLKISHDGRPIDPKLIRVIPILKRVSNAVPKPPSSTHVKRILGCSWSAFRGKARESLEQRKTPVDAEGKRSACEQSTSKTSKACETSRRLDLAPEVSFDANKNYAKGVNKMLNGTRASKKLIMEEDRARSCGGKKVQRVARNAEANRKRRKTKKRTKNSREGREASEDDEDEEEEEDSSGNCSAENLEIGEEKVSSKFRDVTIENIAERIKKRRIDEIADKTRITAENSRARRNSPRKKSCRVENRPANSTRKAATKRRKVRSDPNSATSGNDSSENAPNDDDAASDRPKKSSGNVKNGRLRHSSDPENDRRDLDERIIEEQTRMERLIDQEKRDFELAVRLQAQFDDIERISGRTRGSRHRAMENFDRVLDLELDDDLHDRRNDKQRRRPRKNVVK